VVILFVLVVGLVARNQVKVANNREASRAAALAEAQRQAEIDRLAPPIREALFNELQAVPLANCTFERFGEKNDGGYLLCSNLLQAVKAGYSYGISGYDGWGCDISTRQQVPRLSAKRVRRSFIPNASGVLQERKTAGRSTRCWASCRRTATPRTISS